MEAKDTVTQPYWPQTYEEYLKDKLVQAEVSFKAGFKYALEGAVIEGGYESVKKVGIREVVEPSAELLEIGRKAIEATLIEWRDSRLSMLNRANGLVVKEKDGSASSIIRFGPEAALRIGMKAMGQAKLEEWNINTEKDEEPNAIPNKTTKD